MRPKVKVLIVDDSSVIRKVLSDLIESDPSFEVVGKCKNGREAVDRLVQGDHPDVMTLDVEMPVLDGLSTLKELRDRKIRLPIVMFSTLTERGGRATLDALSYGASDYVTKPDSAKNLEESLNRIRGVLLPKLKALGERQRTRGRGPTRRPVPPPTRAAAPAAPAKAAPVQAAPATPPRPGATRTAPRRVATGRPDAVMIGISTGGPNALQTLMADLRVDVPVAIVQHMPAMFTRLLAERLDSISKMEVVEGQPGMEMKPGRAIIAPGNFHMTFKKTANGSLVVETNTEAPVNSCRPAVDVTFRSALEHYGPNCLSVIMTGMGHDGADSAAEFHECGGRVYAQDEETSVVWGMPGAVVQRGIADKVLPLDDIAKEIMGTVGGLGLPHRRTA